MEVEEFLEHHGVKGMRWGVRRNPAKRLERANANAAVLGYGLRGWAAQKVAKKQAKKTNVKEFTTKEYNKLSDKEQKRYDAKIKRKAYSSVIGRTFIEASLVGGVGALSMRKLNLDAKAKESVKQGAVAAIGIMTMMRAQQVRGVHTSYKIDKLRKEVHGN